MSPRPRSISDEEVLEGVARVIGRLGPARFTLADVAAEVGLAPPTLVQRFGSKRGLLLAFAEHGAAGATREFEAARARSASPLGALVEALARMTRFVETPEQLANHLALLHLDLSDAEFHRHALTHARAVRAEIGSLLRQAVEAGELRSDDPDALGRVLYSVYNGALLGWAVYREGGVEERVRIDLEQVLRPWRTGGSAAGGETSGAGRPSGRRGRGAGGAARR